MTDMNLTQEIVNFLLETLFYFLLNFGILIVLLCYSKIPSSRFIGNLVIAAILSIVLHLFLGLDSFSIIEFKGPWLCGIQAFVKNILKAVIPLTIFGVSFERVRSLPKTHPVQCFLSMKNVFCMTWLVAAFLSFPQLFAYEYFPNLNSAGLANRSFPNGFDCSPTNGSNSSSLGRSSECRKTPLLGKVWVKLFYECFICFVLHFGPAIYSIYALHKIKFKLSYIWLGQDLKQTIGPRLYKKLKHIRLAFLYTTVFALIWIPYGAISVWRSITENPNMTVVNVNFNSPKRKLQKGIQRVFMTAHPILYLYTHHHSRFTSFLRMCKCRKQSSRNEEIMAVSTIPMETYEISG